MYIPAHFAEPKTEVMHDLIRAHPLSTLVVLSSGGLDANHLPLHLSAEPAAPLGTLRGHVARANPLWRDFVEEVEVLAIFQGPESYISPSWYPTKAETGKVVPTWNYAVVHAHGKLRVLDDAAWLRAHLAALTAHNEMPFDAPWQPSDAPPDYLEKLMVAIVGIEIVVTRLCGKWKTSQNQPPRNQAGIVCGLNASAHPSAAPMAALVAKHRVP